MKKTNFSFYKTLLMCLFVCFGFGLASAQVTVTGGGGAVPDNGYDGTLGSMLAVPVTFDGVGAPTDIEVSISMTHTWNGDLTIKLGSPDGTILGLVSRPNYAEAADDGTGCCGLNLDLDGTPITFSDAGAVDAELMGAGGGDYFPSPQTIAVPPATFAEMAGLVADAAGDWTLYVGDGAGGDLGEVLEWSLTLTGAFVVDPCELTCPSNIIIDLGAGECNSIVSYAITGNDNCLSVPNPPLFEGFAGPFDPANWSFTDNGTGGSVDASGAPDEVSITSGNVNVGGDSELSIASPAAGFIVFDWDYATGDPGFESFGYSVNGVQTELAGAAGSGSESVAVAAGDVFAFYVNTEDGMFGSGTVTLTNFALSDGTSSVDLAIVGPASGTFVDPGTHTVTATGSNSNGDAAECSFTITVNEYSGPVNTSLACNDNVQVSVDQNCMAMIGADEILEGGPYACYDDYIVNIQGIVGDVNGVSTTLPSGTHTVTVTDPNTNNSCWGTILVEDKLPPVIECVDVDLVCGESTDPVFTPPVMGSISQTQVSGDAIGPDGGTITTSVMNVTAPAGARVTDLNLRIDLTHSFVGDMAITLTSPSGNNIAIWGGNCGGADDMILTFDDESLLPPNMLFCVDLAMDLDVQLNGITPSFMSDVDGDALGGNWTLTIVDNFNLDGGALNDWTIIADYAVAAPYAPIASDNCDNNVELTYTDATTGDECVNLSIARTWIATDDAGNTASCVQTINVAPVSLDNVTFPGTYEGECGESTNPSNTGWPTVNGSIITPGNSVCNIFVEYWDKPFVDCGNGSKIQRTWTVLDWCNQTSTTGIQLIKLSDNVGPVLSCPSDIEVNTDFWYCYANVSLPQVSAFDACGGAITYSASSTSGNVVQLGNNFVINQLPIGTHTVTYVATDACGNSSSCDIDITVADNVPPVPNCDEHTIVSLTNDGPKGLTLIPATVFDDGSYDNCSDVTFRARRMTSCIDFDWTTDGACLDDAPNGLVNSRDRGTVLRGCIPVACCDVAAGPIMVELEVTDGSGNINYCMVEVEVQDKLAPFLIAPPDIIVSCDFWFDSEVPTGVFVPANEAGLNVFGTVLDAYEYNDNEAARQYITINDPGAPGPQPKTWGRDGWADDNCNVDVDVRTTILDDCSGDALPASAPNNAVRCIERTWRAQDAQGNSTTQRQRIYVVDYDRFDANDITWPVDLPSSGCTFDECPEGEMTPENLAAMGFATRCVRPRFNDDNCSLIGVTYDDTRFDFVDGACFKILREWTIIDWCQYDANTGDGIWKHTQVIKVIDNNGPEFQDCPAGPVTLCVEDEGVELASTNQVFLGEGAPMATACRVHVDLSHVVVETCSDVVIYDVKIYPFNGTNFVYLQSEKQVSVGEDGTVELTASSKTAATAMIRKDGLPYNSKWCGDYHRVLWSVEDGCGNLSTCEYLVRLEDCKKPSPVCINGISTVVMPVGGTVTIWAKEFNVSSIDDCTPSADLLYSFSGTSYEPSKEYNCDNVPAFGAELSEQVWVADGGVDHNCNNQISWSERNTDFCTTTIVITDNEGTCTDGGSLTVAGDVTTDMAQTVENTTVTLTSPTSVFPTVITPDNGVYSFIAPLGNNYTVDAERNDDHKNGVSTLDLVRIQKHLLGVQPFDNPYDLIAADANNNEAVSALDLVELRKLILGIYTELPNNESWRFVDQSFEFSNPAQPWPFDETIDINNLSSDMMDNDFVAVKVGDVNNTVVANATQIVTRNLNGVFNMITDDRNVVAGETVNVTFSAESFNSLVGYQFTMNANGLELTNVKGATTDVTSENVAVVEGQITASWNKVKGVDVSADDAMFTLEFVATVNGKLSQMLSINSDITEAEAYNRAEDIMNIGLVFRGGEKSDFSLYQNEPNPFDGKTIVGFDLPEAGAATLTVFDVTGKVITVIDGDYAQGFNRISLDSKDLSATGVMYYRLDAGEYTATKKMVVIK